MPLEFAQHGGFESAERKVVRAFEPRARKSKRCRVALAGSGREARERFRAEAFELAFVDLKLPDASGIDLLRELRARQPTCQVVIMTGHSTVRSAV
ncbi:MAG: response regulator, partial [Chloroflexi bacterium]|nr:response regulator [Chloroflexota bacterium]